MAKKLILVMSLSFFLCYLFEPKFAVVMWTFVNTMATLLFLKFLFMPQADLEESFDKLFGVQRG
jgi:hypothetical protein